VHRASLHELVTEMSLQSLTEADLDRLVHAWHHLPPWPDSVEGMSRLRPGYVLTTLSNGGMAHLVELNRAARLPFDCVLSVELVRTYKPDPRVYRLVPELLAVRPEESMMVASHAYDLAAAAGQGMRTAFVRRVQEWGTGKPEPLDISVDIVANDFLDLASQLGA
jgi:2-haloacid dehalogenase